MDFTLKKRKKKRKAGRNVQIQVFAGLAVEPSPEMPLASVIYNATVFPVNSLNEGAVS